jgi:hypothetical protein
MSINGNTCANCIFLQTFNIIKNGNTVPTKICAKNAPLTQGDQQVTPWQEIPDPNNWTCGDGADSNTLLSFSSGIVGIPAAPIDNSQFTSYAPGDITSQTGTVTSAPTQAVYKKIGRTVFVTIFGTLSNVGTASGYAKAALPTAARSIGWDIPSPCIVSAAGGSRVVIATVDNGTSILRIREINSLNYTWTNNDQIKAFATYESAT